MQNSASEQHCHYGACHKKWSVSQKLNKICLSAAGGVHQIFILLYPFDQARLDTRVPLKMPDGSFGAANICNILRHSQDCGTYSREH